MAKYGAEGELIFAKNTNFSAPLFDMDATADGTYLFTGYVNNGSVIDTGPDGDVIVSLAGAGGNAVSALATYDADGTILWAAAAPNSMGSKASVNADHAVTWIVDNVVNIFDADGVLQSSFSTVVNANPLVTTAVFEHAVAGPDNTVVICGNMYTDVVLGIGQENETYFKADVDDKYSYMLMAKYDFEGNLISAERVRGQDTVTDLNDGVPMTNSDTIAGCKVADDGSVLIGGTFDVEAVFDSGDSAETTIEAVGRQDVFLAKYQM